MKCRRCGRRFIPRSLTDPCERWCGICVWAVTAMFDALAREREVRHIQLHDQIREATTRS